MTRILRVSHGRGIAAPLEIATGNRLRNFIVVEDSKKAISENGGDWCNLNTAATATGMLN